VPFTARSRLFSRWAPFRIVRYRIFPALVLSVTAVAAARSAGGNEAG
jgi:hypothetical protein